MEAINSSISFEQYVLTALKDVSSGCSTIGCIVILLIIFLFRYFYFFSERLIFYLTCAALLRSITYLISHPYTAASAELNWCSHVGFFMTLAVKEKSADACEGLFCVISFGLPFLISVIPLTTNSNVYGPAGPWCWILESSVWRFYIWIAPACLATIVMLISFILIVRVYRRQIFTWRGLNDNESQEKREQYRRAILPLLAYPIIHVILEMVALLSRLSELARFGRTNITFLALLATLTPIKGFCNALWYAYSKGFGRELNWDGLRQACYNIRHRGEVTECEVVQLL